MKMILTKLLHSNFIFSIYMDNKITEAQKDRCLSGLLFINVFDALSSHHT